MVTLEIKGKSVSIRPVSISDSTDIFEGLREGGLSAAVPGSDGVKTLDAAKAMVKGLIDRAALGAEFHFAVCLNGRDTKVIGMCALYEFGGLDRSCRIGYWISRPYRGRGYGREAVSLLSKIAFERLGISRLRASSYSSNESSIRLLHSLGFIDEEQTGNESHFSLSKS
ncbi:MAG: GNAT family N-acetyltransferase [Candidatus Micrarchaeota archaeon]|nr:GNAT family N-acetyltransferase [Candidatus Micrarchaeota archaeon]